MSDLAVRADNLSKQYRIGRGPTYRTLRDTLAAWPAAIFQSKRRSAPGNRPPTRPDTVWALQDVSFEIRQGEVAGVIGRNGAGKSTLLKVLSRITEPTNGYAEIYGRVGSLLEVGTGFHAELTGRENIFLNGAILGMRRAEIKDRFDEIVSFAEIDRFIDTPVKHYSSGMYMRLAFAVAAHLKPEILLVDEVLAVGDVAFQKKCLGKMSDVARQGRTVLFVSHNMDALTHLCQTSLVLHNGALVFHGTARDGVDWYCRQMHPSRSANGDLAHVLYCLGSADNGPGYEVEAKITSIELLDESGNPKPVARTWEPLTLRMYFQVLPGLTNLHLRLQFSTVHGTRIATLNTRKHLKTAQITPGKGFADCVIPCLPFAAGDYVVGAGFEGPYHKVRGFREDLAVLTVHPADVFNCGKAPAMPDDLIVFDHHWTIEQP